jgi:ankyrin repeat protein
MAHPLAALCLVVVLAPQASAKGVPDPGQNSLSLAIVLAKDRSGASVIDRDGKFQVVFRNRSAKPIRIWTEYCQPGYETLSFRVEDEEGQISLMHKRSRHRSDWNNKPLQTSTIAPGGTLTWTVDPSGVWGERVWKGVPEPNTGKPVRLRAVFEIKPGDAAREQGVWTGRVLSGPVEALVLDPNLRTPHEYLFADCPRQALRTIQADRTWMDKKNEDGHTPLTLAVQRGFLDVVRWLLNHGADIKATADRGFTPLHVARDPEVVKLLLEHKVDVNAKDQNDRTALEEAAGWYAFFGGYPEYAAEREKWRAITKLLRDAGAEYDIRSACSLGDVERVQVLAKDKKQAGDKEAMRLAATYGQAKIVKLLLEHGGAPEDADFWGLPVSYFAIEHPSVLKVLFDAGANPKVTLTYRGNGPGPRGSTLLHEAAARGVVESAQLLLARGLDVDAPSPGGYTPLHFACREGKPSMVDWLLQNKANARARTQDGWTPMSLAASQVRPEHEDDNARYQAIVQALGRAGVELDLFTAIACNDVRQVASLLRVDPKSGEIRNPAGRPALHRAVTLDRKEIVKLLLDKGCDPDIRSEDNISGHRGETALLQAAFWGCLEVAEMLLRHGADVNAKAGRGVIPLHEAARMKHLELARLLLKHGADVNAKDDRGETPLDWAYAFGDPEEMVKLLRSYGGQGKERKQP